MNAQQFRQRLDDLAGTAIQNQERIDDLAAIVLSLIEGQGQADLGNHIEQYEAMLCALAVQRRALRMHWRLPG